MSVVLATPGHYDTICQTIQALQAQTVCGQLEIVVVAPSKEVLQLDPTDFADFFSFQVVSCGEIQSFASANAIGIRRATAPIVALAEDHAFPAPEWAATLIETHQQPWAAVGPVMCNANPRTAVSWADFLVAYSPWVDPAPSRHTISFTRTQQQL